MPRYLIERQFVVREDEMPEVGRRSRKPVSYRLPTTTSSTP